MPLFISYSHADKDFVDQLATQLVAQRVSVWLDRWEMHVGDSLLDRIQGAITDASGLLVILSPDSVDSAWCKKELNSGLIRELEERRIVVLPVMYRDCEVPLFLREKMYADFRTDFDDGLHTILEAVSRVTNEWRNRLVEPDWHTDWSIDWGSMDGHHIVRLTLVEVAESQPYTVVTMIDLVPSEPANEWFDGMASEGRDEDARRHVVESLSAKLTAEDFRVYLEDSHEQMEQIEFPTDHGNFLAIIRTRWLGTDTGRDVLFNTAQQIEGIVEQMRLVAHQPS